MGTALWYTSVNIDFKTCKKKKKKGDIILIWDQQFYIIIFPSRPEFLTPSTGKSNDNAACSAIMFFKHQ